MDTVIIEFIRTSQGGEQSTEVSHTEVAAEVESAERVMKVKVCVCGTERTIVLCVTEEQLKRTTVLQLKKKIESVFRIPVYTLAIGLWELYDDELLSDRGITDGSTIELNRVVLHCGRPSSGMGDREGRNQSMDCVAIMLTGSDVSSEAAPHPQPAAVEDLHQD